ncbi:hypothetical protein [Phocaeicola vulgatus]|uniref:hypothetical protein n=1 Tax=Phocaeicola vulgatus TaxID=821 RepID=UPI001E52AAAE|nr:hypothetical protein [Phocaeicola vulgatus]
MNIALSIPFLLKSASFRTETFSERTICISTPPASKLGMNLLCHDSNRTRKHRPLPLYGKDSER